MRAVLTSSGGSESVMSWGLVVAAAVGEVVVVEGVSVGCVELEEVEGTEAGVGIGVEVEVVVVVVDVGLVVVEEVELVGGRVEDLVAGVSGETVTEVVVKVSVKLRGWDGDVVTSENVALELLEETATKVTSSLAVVVTLVVFGEPAGIVDVLVETEEVVSTVVMTEIAASLPTVGVSSAERVPFGSGKVNLVDRSVDVVEITFSLLRAGTVSKVVMEGVVIIVEVEVTEGVGVMDSEEVEVTETGAGGSVGVAVFISAACKVGAGSSVVVGLALLSSSVTFVGVVASVVGLTESVHISVSEGVTVFEGETVILDESGTESEIVGTVGVSVALRAGAGVGGAAALVGVSVSPS